METEFKHRAHSFNQYMPFSREKKMKEKPKPTKGHAQLLGRRLCRSGRCGPGRRRISRRRSHEPALSSAVTDVHLGRRALTCPATLHPDVSDAGALEGPDQTAAYTLLFLSNLVTGTCGTSFYLSIEWALWTRGHVPQKPQSLLLA